MLKRSQNTKFDTALQHKEPIYPSPKQRLLFPEPGEYHSLSEVEIPEIPLQQLNLELPELSTENISTSKMTPEQEDRIQKEIQYYTEQGNKYPYHKPVSDKEINNLKQYLKNNNMSDNLKGTILFKYDQLRKKSSEFYIAYKEANQLAELQFEPNTNGDYISLFKEFGKLVEIELTKEIGRLFGVYAQQGLIDPFKKGINIFNITSLNFEKKLREMDSIIHSMDAILTDYNHRKKIIKKLKPKIDEEIYGFISNTHWQQFLAWMDEYFPLHKDEFIKEAIKAIQSLGKSGDLGHIRFGDLVKFKTFKSIYEKTQYSVTLGLKQHMAKSGLEKTKNELKNQIKQRVASRLFLMRDFLNDLEDTTPENVEEQASKIIKFCKKTFNIDLRAPFSFSQNVHKKRAEKDYEPTQEAAPSMQKALEQMIIKNHFNFVNSFVSQVKKEINGYTDKSILNWETSYSFNNLIESYVNKIITKYNYGLDAENLGKLLSINTKNMDDFASKFVYQILMSAIPGFQEGPIKGYSEFMREEDNGPSVMLHFKGIQDILGETDGKLSIEAFTNYVFKHLPFIDKKILLVSVTALFREFNSRGLNRLSLLDGSDYRNALKAISIVLKKHNKLEPNNFTNILKKIVYYGNSFSSIRVDLPKSFNEEEIIQLIISSVRNPQTLDTDLENLKEFVKMIHNEAGELPESVIINLIKNKNFFNFKKVAIVRKILKAYLYIKNLNGINNIFKTYGPVIKELQKRGMLSSNFKDKLKLIEQTIHSNEEISPKSSSFSLLFETASSIESDLTIMQMGDALKDLLKDYQKKDNNLFKLDKMLNENLRFRVLKDKDPRILRIGIETNCCQRLGGVGEVAARDSFINPLSSVLILEWKDPTNNEWKLLSQSYFHYVPKENGYILDNVESNRKNEIDFTNTTGIKLDEVYGVYANEIKKQFNVAYVLAGKGYSKIPTNSFRTDKRYSDPRYFDDRALTSKSRHHYSDFEEKNSMDLLMPKFNLQSASKKILNEIKKANKNIHKFVKSILHPSLLKIGQVQQQDIRTLSGTNVRLFGPQSWTYINKFMNILNSAIYTLGQGQKLAGQSLNFQSVIRNPTALTKFSGSLKYLLQLSKMLWDIVSNRRVQPYSIDETKVFISNLTNYINQMNIVEQSAHSVKPDLINALTAWSLILK